MRLINYRHFGSFQICFLIFCFRKVCWCLINQNQNSFIVIVKNTIDVGALGRALSCDAHLYKKKNSRSLLELQFLGLNHPSLKAGYFKCGASRCHGNRSTAHLPCSRCFLSKDSDRHEKVNKASSQREGSPLPKCFRPDDEAEVFF